MTNEELGLYSDQQWCPTCNGARRYRPENHTSPDHWIMHSQTECLVAVLTSLQSQLTTIESKLHEQTNVLRQIEGRLGNMPVYTYTGTGGGTGG